MTELIAQIETKQKRNNNNMKSMVDSYVRKCMNCRINRVCIPFQKNECSNVRRFDGRPCVRRHTLQFHFYSVCVFFTAFISFFTCAMPTPHIAQTHMPQLHRSINRMRHRNEYYISARTKLFLKMNTFESRLILKLPISCKIIAPKINNNYTDEHAL